MKSIFLIISMLIVTGLFAQEDNKNDIFNKLNKQPAGAGKVVVNQDYAAKQLVRKHVEVCDDLLPEGFRIIIYSGSGAGSEQKANQVRARFKTANPKLGAYVEYYEPNFKVHIGDFRTKSDALKVYKEIIDDFPGAYIVRDRIELPKL